MVTRIKASNIESGAVTTDKFAAGAVTAEKVDAGAAAGPRISSIDYPGDDTAALPAGGQTVIINGSGFVSGCSVFLNETVVTTVGFVSATQLQITAPARSTGTYLLYVVNPDGGTAISVPGMVYSGTPTWTTASGSLGTPYETAAVSINLAATGDGSLTYAVTSGSSLPAGISLTSGGLLSGTVPATAADTTYNFELDVIDSENQSTTRQFSITYKVDVVTWSSPAESASFSWTQNSANSTSLTATSAAGKSVSYSVQSGSLPAGVTVSGSSITGTPTTVQANTSAIIRATAATTNRFADRTLYFIVPSAGPSMIGEAFGGGYYAGQISYNGNGTATHYLVVSPKSTGETFGYWKDTNTSTTGGTSSLVNGLSNSNSMNNSSHPAAQFCRGLTIGGYTDWYLPALYELEILYYNLKIDTAANDTSYGANPYSVPPRNSNYTSNNPTTTTAQLFQNGGSQAVYATWHWTSTSYTDRLGSAYELALYTGTQQYNNYTTNRWARAIRRVPI